MVVLNEPPPEEVGPRCLDGNTEVGHEFSREFRQPHFDKGTHRLVLAKSMQKVIGAHAQFGPTGCLVDMLEGGHFAQKKRVWVVSKGDP